MKLIDIPNQIKKIEVPTNMTVFNPSLISVKGGSMVLVRVVEEDKTKKNRNGFFYSENWIINYDENLNVKNYLRIDDEEIILNRKECSYGLEDGRLFCWNDEVWVIFSGLNIENNQFINTMCIAKIVENKLENFQVIASPENLKREKNWIPLIKNNDLYFVYKIDPLEIYLYKDNKLELIFKSKYRKQKSFISGSSTALKYDDRFIFISHHRKKINILKKIFLKLTNKEKYKKNKVIFYHQLHVLDASFSTILSSEKFIFEKKGIEFCAGMDILDNEVKVSYGVADKTANIMLIKKDIFFEKLMNYLGK
ncbi:hypothetical protein LHV13_05745 [Ferrovum sp. PN-J185]|uniref:hypothetical protein n=1 Tax=Ferrovum sp. PN-J185 TaxID=1356306 RepID=UPI000793F424|nr:hypothetical protein [Ferrovum sp. PN-J185]KXW55934.1 hypothetical protein FV185_10940 [Ferrovum sp. PN-J185]MCC6068678.1 hypothetical protein [Ferrovum sp. PN-J185]MDE1891919.1 hypothetical protein [Betaproteobacteria bacterium]MDE2057000.1 hypothetical protein [Betaproteobacteria bacterium]